MDSGPSVVCVLCQRSEENKITGPLSTKEEVTAHENCLLYSSALVSRESPQFDDLFGFSAQDVMAEVHRGRKLTCSKCKKRGATVGCEKKRCKKSYHYPCAIQSEAKTFEDRENGRFGLYCLHCQKIKQVGRSDDDSNLSSTSTVNSKRRLDFSDQQEEKKAKRPNRIISDDSTNSDVTNAGDDIAMFAPLESDSEENANPAPDELRPLFKPQLNRKSPMTATGSGSDNLKENENKSENEVVSVVHSDANSESLLLCVEASDIAMDSSNFWKDCNSAGCTQAIFSDFIKEMRNIFTRITSEQASQQDYDVAFNVMMASGKLGELVAQQQKDLQKKLTELQQAASALDKVALALGR